MDFDKRNLTDPDPELKSLADDLERLSKVLLRGVRYEKRLDSGDSETRMIHFTPSIIRMIETLDTKLERVFDASTANPGEDPIIIIGDEQLEALKSTFVAIASPLFRKTTEEKESINESLTRLRLACDGAFERMVQTVDEYSTCTLRPTDEDAFNSFFAKMYRIDSAYDLISHFLVAPEVLPKDMSQLDNFQRDLQWADMKQFALRLHKIYITAKEIQKFVLAIEGDAATLTDLQRSSHLEDAFKDYSHKFLLASSAREQLPIVPIELIAADQNRIDELIEIKIDEGVISKDLAAEIWYRVKEARDAFNSSMETEFPKPPEGVDIEGELGFRIDVRVNVGMLEVMQAFREKVFGDPKGELPDWARDAAGDLTADEVTERSKGIVDLFAEVAKAAESGKFPIQPPTSGPGSLAHMQRGVLIDPRMWTGTAKHRSDLLEPLKLLLPPNLNKTGHSQE